MSYRSVLAVAAAVALAACSSTTARNPDRPGEALTLVKPADQSLRRGETNKVSVFVSREAFDAPVDLKVDNLPKGLEVVETKPRVEAGSTQTEITLYAHPDADLVTGHAVRVTAVARNDLKAVEWFHVAVKPQ
jgi:hypothetical protein